MFSKTRVLLILGAGASAEFGLPLGWELKDGIVEDVEFYFGRGGELRDGDGELYQAFQRQCSEPRNVVRVGRELAAILKAQYTIDEALHYLSSQPDSVTLGKLAIVRRILKGETDSVLSNSKETGAPNVERARETWIAHFLSMILAGLRKEDVANCLASVSAINFNYDRSLEHYFYWALQQHGHADPDTAKVAVGRMNVIRPYGVIGPLEWQQEAGVRFGDAEPARNPGALAANIRTFTEQLHDGIREKKSMKRFGRLT